jgi:hypothetical protein
MTEFWGWRRATANAETSATANASATAKYGGLSAAASPSVEMTEFFGRGMKQNNCNGNGGAVICR